ncbi:alpha/beta hydrolase [Streptosporangium sp. CA-135522]|uniref:alpha/beta hydrolase n=1 Tax=Streptosporangium sp. CA-135522 TaxID=3240072 RepID=UPI003D935E6D
MPFAQLRRFIEAYLNRHPGDDPALNPMAADLTGLPPILVQAGVGDPLTCGAQRLVARAQSHGVDAKLQLYPASSHIFHLYWSFLPEAADAIEQVGSFIRSGSLRSGSVDAADARR